jgi:hypothetical protein
MKKEFVIWIIFVVSTKEKSHLDIPKHCFLPTKQLSSHLIILKPQE